MSADSHSAMRRRAICRAASGYPWCIASAPQQPPGRGRSAVMPQPAIRFMVARWAGRKAPSITQPVRTIATVAPSPTRRGSGRASSRRPAGGRVARCAAGSSRSSRDARSSATPHMAASTARRRGSTHARPSRLAVRTRRGRSGSVWARAASIMRPYGTPLGHAASQARHARHSSIMRVKAGPTDASPSSTARIAAMRPLGDAVSRPVSRKVGQCGRHRPQPTQVTTSSGTGAGRRGSQPALTPPSPGDRPRTTRG